MDQPSHFLHFDLDYEFDAPKFFDFTTLHLPPHDLDADRWFLFANSYPPSPLIMKLKWRADELDCGESSTCNSSNHQHDNTCNHSTDVSMDSENTPRGNGSQKSENKSQLRPYLSRSSTLLKPTASHLAKLVVSSTKSSGRTQNPGSSVNRSGDAIATKRQKLENGYLKKQASQLRHQTSFSHKSSGKAIPFSSGSTPSKSKVTVPKGPILETNRRARRFRSMKSACQGGTKKSTSTFKALPLNRKILEGPPLVQLKKTTRCLPVFHEFHLRTTERAMQNSSDNEDLSSGNSPLSLQSPKYENRSLDVVYRFKSQPANTEDLKFPGNRKCAQKYNPPAELFSKLSLTSNNPSVASKKSKENIPNSLPQNKIVSPSKSPRCNVKHSQFGGVKVVTNPNFTRSFRIH